MGTGHLGRQYRFRQFQLRRPLQPAALHLLGFGHDPLDDAGWFKRRYLTALYKLVNGPMQTGLIAPILDAKYAAFQEHGVTATSPDALKTWITSARNYILSQLAKDSGTFAITNIAGTNIVTLSGTGPLNMASLSVNTNTIAVKWTGTKAWTAEYTPETSEHELVISALDSDGQPVAGTEVTAPLDTQRAVAILKNEVELLFVYPVLRSGVYKLESTVSLESPAWTTLNTQTASVGVAQFKISIPTNSTAFYRVVEP